MALELRYPRSKWWYGRVAIGERRILKNPEKHSLKKNPPTSITAVASESPKN